MARLTKRISGMLGAAAAMRSACWLALAAALIVPAWSAAGQDMAARAEAEKAAVVAKESMARAQAARDKAAQAARMARDAEAQANAMQAEAVKLQAATTDEEKAALAKAQAQAQAAQARAEKAAAVAKEAKAQAEEAEAQAVRDTEAAKLAAARAQGSTPAATAKSGASSADLGLLKSRGIEPTAQGIAAFFKGFNSDQTEQTARALIAKLADENYKVREDATVALVALPILPEKALAEGLKSTDPEVVSRITRVREESRAVPPSVVMAAIFCVVEAEKTKGACAVIGDNLAQVPPHLQERAIGAMAAAAGPDDEDRFRKLLKDARPPVRLLAMRTLARVLGEKFNDDLVTLCKDSDEAMRLAAATTLAEAGNRAALEPLVDLLASKAVNTRYAAHRLLSGLTGQKIKFSAADADGARQPGVDAWKKWVADNGKTAELNHPMKSVEAEYGRVLFVVTANNSAAIIELDEQHKEAVNIPLRHGGPWSVQRVGEGRYLVGLFTPPGLQEYTAKGEADWKVENLPEGVMRAIRLPNGNTLVAGTDANEAWEYDPNGKKVWTTKKLSGRVTDARRLANGNTLVCMHQTDNRVIELDKDGNTVWELAVKDPQGAQRLESGNTLVVQAIVDGGTVGEVSEYDKSGKKVWTYTATVPLDARRLPSGNTLIADSTGIIEVDKDGRKVWAIEKQSVVRLHQPD